jgi:glycosyltransferase involved in cell wall biosynthesis
MPDERRRVLYVSHNHPMFRPGGAEQYALDLYRAMSRSAEFEPVLLARAGPPVARSKLLHQGPPVTAANGDPNQYLIFTDLENYDYLNNELAGKPVLTRFLREFLVAQQPDIVHFHHALYYGYDVLRVTRNALPRAPIVFTLHDYMAICHRDGQMVKAAGAQMCLDPSPLDCSECFPHAGTQRFFMRKRFIQSHLALVDRFVAPTATTKERFVEWGIPAEKIIVEPYGSSPPARAAMNGSTNGGRTARKRNRFAFFGQLTPYKGADVLLEAMRLLGPDFDGHLWLFGANLDLMDERFQARLRRLADSAGATVTLAGQYDHGDVLDLMEDMDWIMVPSIWAETGPFVVSEAFHARRPVICSPVGGLSEKVRHGENGLYFRRNDAQSLAALMRQAASDPALWQELHEQIRPPYGMDSHLQVLTGTYRELLEGMT